MTIKTLFRTLLLGLSLTMTGAHSASTDAERLHTLFKEDWEWRKQNFPTFASSLGDLRFADKLTDYSAPARAARRTHAAELQQKLAQIEQKQLGADDTLSYALFADDVAMTLRQQALHGQDGLDDDWTLLNHLSGIHIAFSQMMASTRFDSAADYRNYLTRLRAFPAQADQVIVLARRGIASGWTLPRVVMQRVPPQIDQLIGSQIDDTPWFSPFTAWPAALPEAERKALAGEARTVFAKSVIPALHRLKHFIEHDYLPAAREDIAASRLPAGPAAYALAIEEMTTTTLTAQQIHDLGLSEVARISRQMDELAHKQGFTGKGQDFIKALRERPDQYYDSGEELIKG